MDKFLKHSNGDFFRVSDVIEKDGLLQTTTGAKLSDPVAIPPAPNPQAAPITEDQRVQPRPN